MIGQYLNKNNKSVLETKIFKQKNFTLKLFFFWKLIKYKIKMCKV